MRPLLSLSLAIIACGLMACKKPAVPEITASPDTIFDLSRDQLGITDATSVITAIRELAKANDEPVSVKFIADKRSYTFDIMLAEHEDDYDIKPIVKIVDGKRIHSKPPAEPPGNIDPTWIRVTAEGIVVGGSMFSDAEFADWLKGYASAINAISERSALVLNADPGVKSARLFEILAMQVDLGLDRFLIEKEAQKQDDAIPIPQAPSPVRSNDSDLD